jgi:hypothetical protein
MLDSGRIAGALRDDVSAEDILLASTQGFPQMFTQLSIFNGTAEEGRDRSREPRHRQRARRDLVEVVADDQPAPAVTGNAAEEIADKVRQIIWTQS